MIDMSHLGAQLSRALIDKQKTPTPRYHVNIQHFAIKEKGIRCIWVWVPWYSHWHWHWHWHESRMHEQSFSSILTMLILLTAAVVYGYCLKVLTYQSSIEPRLKPAELPDIHAPVLIISSPPWPPKLPPKSPSTVVLYPSNPHRPPPTFVYTPAQRPCQHLVSRLYSTACCL